ncbi:MAG: hypothetical protein KIS66_02595 [Fimbriimonadaceae bacterium]|nr:hypothetical protein [Fimbriimonadaceae bacterium]
MDTGFVRVILIVGIAFLLHTLVLGVAKRWAGRQGLDVVSAWLSLSWWFVIDATVMVVAYLLSSSMYLNWFPPEPVADSTMLGPLFAQSDLAISDLMAAAYVLVTCALSHALAYAGIFVAQSLADGGFRLARVFVPHALGLLAIGGLYGAFMYRWEAVVLALRTAELVGSPRTDRLLHDIVGVADVGAIVGGSWLLGTLYLLWPLLIAFVAWGATRANLVYHNLLADDEPGATSDPAPTPASTERPNRPTPRIPAPNPSRELDPEPAPNPNLAATNGRVPANLQETSAHPRVDEVLAESPRAAAASIADPDPSHVQELLDEVERQRAAREAAEDEIRGLRRNSALNPLDQPNRRDPGGVDFGGPQ